MEQNTNKEKVLKAEKKLKPHKNLMLSSEQIKRLYWLNHIPTNLKKEHIDHNGKFADMQNLYIKTRHKKYLSEMYLILLDYYDNLLRNYIKKNRCVICDYQLKLEDMATRTIEHYLANREFKIKKLSAYAYFDFIKILAKDEKFEKTVSIEMLDENNKERGIKNTRTLEDD